VEKIMRSLTRQDADAYLLRIGMKVGDWNQIKDIDSSQNETWQWINHQAPRDARQLYNFAQHLVGWLPKGEWKLLQIDNSTILDPVQLMLIAALLAGPGRTIDLGESRSFLFEFLSDEESNASRESLICNLIFALLLFEGHCQLVSSASKPGQCLSLQDGFAYFYSKEIEESGAREILQGFQKNPDGSPQWVLKIVADSQERILRSDQTSK
jgi:hypothetical protein